MKILVSGSNGFIGSSLVTFLEYLGHTVICLVRRPSKITQGKIYWDPYSGKIDRQGLEGLDGVVHLAGESIAARWTAAKMERIRDSRVLGTRILSEALADLQKPPKVFISASAIGYYGSRAAEWLREDSSPGEGFLAKVCKDWEAKTVSAKECGIRVVLLRLGMVMSSEGGALQKILLPFRMGFGGKIGSGHQYMSWISLDDLMEVIMFALKNESLDGPVNAVSPTPITNIEYTKALGRVLKRPTVIPLPGFVARLIFSRMADDLLLASQRVKPVKLNAAGFSFKYPELEPALRHLLNKSH